MGIIHAQTPDLTIIMTLHVGGLLTRLQIRFDDGSSSETNDELRSFKNVDSSDQGWELNDILDFVGGAIDDVHSSVFTTGVEGSIQPNDGTDETALVETKSLDTGSTVPDVDERVGTTTISFSSVISSNARE